MADISTAVSMARVPILGEDGRISDDYIPAAIGENVAKAESAATRAETAATAAEGSASAAGQSAAQASGSASAASESASQAQQSATTADGAATSAQSAQTAAEAAKTAAANSAQDAQQSATAAAESAASVADKFITSAVATTLDPGSPATASVADQVLTIGVPKGDKGDKGEKGDTGTGVPEGGTPGQLLSKTEDGTAWVDPPSGNVLKGTLGPAPVLSADDAYATKPRRLTVHGNTRQNLWSNPSGTNNGVTVTSNADGSMTLSGTATSAASVSSADSYIMKPSTAYTLSMNAALTGASFVVTEYDADGSQLAQHNASSTSAASFTSSASVARCVMSLSVQSGQTVSGTYRVMLNEGSTAQPWCPPGLNSVDELSLVTAGKNYFPRLSGGVFKGITVTANSDGSYTLNGTSSATDAGAIALNVNGIPKGHELTLSYYGYDSTAVKVQVYFKNIDGAVTYIDVYKTPKTFTIPEGATQISARVVVESANTTVNNVTVYPQLELGSTATAYEPPAVTTTPIDLDGHTLNSLPDGTCDELTIDATGAVTLVKRTNTVKVVADNLTIKRTNERYSDFDLAGEPRYSGGTSFALGANDQVNSLSRVRNADQAVQAGDRGIGIYDLASQPASTFRIGIPSEDADSQLANCKSWLGSTGATAIYAIKEPQTIPLTAVTLPTLPSPNITVYHDSDAPSDITLEYERDVTIAFGKLAKQIAGTASAVAVREASTIEEE